MSLALIELRVSLFKSIKEWEDLDGYISIVKFPELKEVMQISAKEYGSRWRKIACRLFVNIRYREKLLALHSVIEEPHPAISTEQLSLLKALEYKALPKLYYTSTARRT